MFKRGPGDQTQKPHINNSGEDINTSERNWKSIQKQKSLAAEAIRMEQYLNGLMELRKKFPDLHWSELVIRKTAEIVAEDKDRYFQKYGCPVPMTLEEVS